MTPATNSKELIWAGSPEVKGKIENRIRRSIQIPNSSLILNWGEYGSGKTHAARYFNKQLVLEDFAENTGQKIPFSLNINFPKSKQPVWEIYTNVVDKLDINNLRNIIEDTTLNSFLTSIQNNIFVHNVLKLIFNKNINESLVKSYLYKNISNADFNKYFIPNGVQRKLETDSDYTEFLALLFSLITYEKNSYSCVIIWIDEFEDITIQNTINITNINNFIKSILDKAPNNLLIFLNFTLSAMADKEDLGEYLQEAVKSRIKGDIEFRMPNNIELKEYLKDLFNNSIYRDAPRNDYFPFDEEVIDDVIKDLGTVSLRRFNEEFSLLLESALFDGKENIGKVYYESMKSETISWKN